jgi:hypothetical protein
MMYKIYEIPGTKIGCCQDEEIRIRKQQGFNDWIILAETDDIMEASKLERIFQKQKGYPVDKMPYWRMVENANKITEVKTESSRKNVTKAGLVGSHSRSDAKVKAARINVAKATEAAVRAGAPGKAGKANAEKPRKCPHCGKEGKGPTMFRYHYGNCKNQ